MSDMISRQLLDLWNRYKPTIAVDAIEYDRELKKLLDTNLASLGTDCISREQAIETAKKMYVACETNSIDDYEMLMEEALKALPPAEPKRIRGKWMGADTQCGIVCSVCGVAVDDFCHSADYIDLDYEPNFCPHCGAKMEVTE